MYVAASSPQWVSRDQVPASVLESEREVLVNQAKASGKPEKVIEKMVEGRLEKFYGQVCLLEQPFVKNPDVTVQELLKELIGKIGENIVIRRFARFQLGEE